MEARELSIVVPVYNEFEGLSAFLQELLPFAQSNQIDLIFVNDGSTDRSAELLKPLEALPGVSLVSHKLNQGYGGALKSGLRAAKTPYVLTMDSDGQHSVEEVLPTLAFAKAKDADLVVGNRNWGRQSITFRSVGKKIILALASVLMPVKISDLNSGFKLYRTELVQAYLPFCPNSMSFSDIITLLFINQRRLVLEKPISVRERTSGKSTINLGTAFETLVSIINVSVMFNPYRIFFPLAFIALFLGLAWGLPIVLQGRGVSVGSVLLLIGGGLLFAIGLLAGQLSALRLQLIEEFQYPPQPLRPANPRAKEPSDDEE